MAAWLTIYCTRSVASITADDLISLLNDLDLYTIAEGFGIEDEEEVVDHALAHLRIEPVSKPKGVKFVVHYKPGKSRPVYVHLWNDPKRVQTEREEALELLNNVRGRPVAGMRRRIAACVEVVALELGLKQVEDVGLVLAVQIAEFLAGEGAGLGRDHNDNWWGF
jgi:hypothetical protein